MGGLAGHLNHLYDNPNLTFAQIKDIFAQASGGKLLGTEKVDGINIFLSYSIREDKAKAARNKGNIKSGGLDAQGLISKFSDKPELSETFKDAINSWESAINKLHLTTKQKIFGNDADIYYNVEILDPKQSNVIQYDNRNLIIHQTGHAFFNKSTGQIEDIDVTENYELLQLAINKIQQFGFQSSFKLVNSSVQTLKSLNDKQPLHIALSRLNNLQEATGLSDKETIGDYISTKVEKFCKSQIPGLTPSTVRDLIIKITGTGGLRIDKILAKTPDDQKEKVKSICNNPSIVLNQAIAPLEGIIHDFSVEILKGLQSIFILDNNKEIQRLRGEVSQAISSIQNSGNEEAISILKQQLPKLKSAENLYTASEGFVFSYEGNNYKFTGNFAPVNQILGLFKYGKGSIPPLKHIVKESSKNRILALMPGSFKPPHIGHYLGAKYLADIDNVDEVRIIISPKSRFDSQKKTEFTAEQALKIWNIFVANDPKIKPVLSKVTSPVQDVYDTMSELHQGDTLLLGMGEKDSGDTRFNRAQEWSNKNNLGVKVNPINTNVGKYSNISATKVRDLVTSGDKLNFFRVLPNHLSTQEKEEVWIILTNNTMKEHIVKKGSQYCLVSKKNSKNLGCYDSHAGAENREKQVQYFKHVNEISSMGGGSVEGGMGGMEFDPKKKKPPETINKIKEENFIDRQRFVAELNLRDIIRQNIHSFMEEQKIVNELIKECIREKIIMEKTDVGDNVHASTGINVLEDLLKKIVPQIEQDYKTLTSDIEQRKSFRAHILNAVSKTLTTADINQSAGDEEDGALSSPESLQEEIDVDIGAGETSSLGGEPDVGSPDASKFININSPKKSKDADKSKDFGLPGQNETGRNMAMMTYDKIEKNILDSYDILSDNGDQKIFYDYLLTNLKLYFDKFESELSTQVKEPEVDATDGSEGGDDASGEKGIGTDDTGEGF